MGELLTVSVSDPSMDDPSSAIIFSELARKILTRLVLPETEKQTFPNLIWDSRFLTLLNSKQ
jgi:hypothetical protein